MPSRTSRRNKSANAAYSGSSSGSYSSYSGYGGSYGSGSGNYSSPGGKFYFSSIYEHLAIKLHLTANPLSPEYADFKQALTNHKA